MKRKTAFLLAFLLAFAAIPAFAQDSIDLVRVEEDLYLYSDPGSSGTWCCYVNEGDWMFYTGESVRYGGYTWYCVLYDGGAVYICERYATVYPDVSYVTADNYTMLRRGAGDEYKAEESASYGETFRVVSFDWDKECVLWYRVECGSRSLYISSRDASPEWSESLDEYNDFVEARLTEEHMATRSGPSTKYFWTGNYYTYGSTVRLYSRVYDDANDIWWVQADAYYKGACRRVYTGHWRFADLDVYDLPEESVIGWATVRSTAQMYYGPGSEYDSYNLRLYAGDEVAVWTYEDGWAQVDCKVDGTRYRAWIDQDKLW